MHVKGNNEVRSCKHCCSGAIRITNSVCDFVALGTQHSMRMSHIADRGLPGYFATIFHKWHDF